MREGRATFRDLLGRIDAYLRANGQSERLHELEVFWRAVEGPSDAVASQAFEGLLALAQGQGFDEELLPFVEASRLWAIRLAALRPTGSLGSSRAEGPVGTSTGRRPPDISAVVRAPLDRAKGAG